MSASGPSGPLVGFVFESTHVHLTLQDNSNLLKATNTFFLACTLLILLYLLYHIHPNFSGRQA